MTKTRTGDSFEISMDEALMQELLYTLLPQAEGMELTLNEGNALFRLSSGDLKSIDLRVTGTVRIVDSDIPMYAAGSILL